jgi:cytidylate kinase
MSGSHPFLVAVDGPAASGKGAIADDLARLYSYPHLDSGLLYRAVGVAVLAQGGDLDDAFAAGAAARALRTGHLEDPALRTREAGEAASRVAVHAAVRGALLDFQRAFAAQRPGSVIDGRDIGTVIAPWAPAKLFVVASPEVRATRRWRQLESQGQSLSYDDVLADIRLRDARDSGRAAAPMTMATDSVLLDTTEMSIEQATDAARRIVETARGRWGRSQAG